MIDMLLLTLSKSGLCVYEVDDPATAEDHNIDETAQVHQRIAELEGVFRELKNNARPDNCRRGL